MAWGGNTSYLFGNRKKDYKDSSDSNSSDSTQRDHRDLEIDVNGGVLYKVSPGVYSDCDGNRYDENYQPIE